MPGLHRPCAQGDPAGLEPRAESFDPAARLDARVSSESRLSASDVRRERRARQRRRRSPTTALCRRRDARPRELSQSVVADRTRERVVPGIVPFASGHRSARSAETTRPVCGRANRKRRAPARRRPTRTWPVQRLSRRAAIPTPSVRTCPPARGWGGRAAGSRRPRR